MPQAQIIISGGKRPAEPPDWPEYEVALSKAYGEGVIRVIPELALVFEFDSSGKPLGGSVQSTDEIIRFVSRSSLPNRPIGLWEMSEIGVAELTDALSGLNARLQ